MKETLRKVWENEYVKTATMVILIIAIFSGFWFGSQMALNTHYPALAVASTSMLPTLNVGDLIIVQGVDPAEINAQYITGDIVVFRSPSDPDKLIVHRAVKMEARGDGYWITTQGDKNPGPDQPFHESYLIGKVIARILYLGNFALLVHVQEGIWFFIILIMILIGIFFAFPSSTGDGEKTTEEDQTQEKRKLFGKLDIEIVYLLILNSLIIGFMVFSLWGVFTFWQLGADPPQHVTIRGMYPDLQYHESFEESVFLSQGLFMYKIDCLVDGAIRPGVPTLSWMQVSILILFLLNFRVLINFVKSRKIIKKEQNLSLYKQNTNFKICNSNHRNHA